MSEHSIEEIISDNLPVAYQENALDFIRFLRENEMELIRDNGYWKNKIYYLIKFQNKYMCFIAIKDPDEKDNFWTVWSDDCSSNWLENFPIEKELKETAWEHADVCQNCGSCSGGRKIIIFGKEFDNICTTTFRFDNPDAADLLFMKKLLSAGKREILQGN